MLNMKNTLSDNHLHTFALTSYIFISAILVFLGGATLLELWQIGKIGLTILCGLFIVFIIGLFWCNYYGVSESKKVVDFLLFDSNCFNAFYNTALKPIYTCWFVFTFFNDDLYCR